MGFDAAAAKLEHLITRKRNAELISVLHQIKYIVDTSKDTEVLTCSVLQDLLAVVLRGTEPQPQPKAKTDAGDANAA